MRKSNRATQASGGYEIGKGRPPVATRWKPGQSGNPRGRRRGTKNLLTLLAEALNEKIKIQEKGKVRTITAREGIIKRVLSEALKGDFKAIQLLLTYEPKLAQPLQDTDPLSLIDDYPKDGPLTAAEQTRRAAATYFSMLNAGRR